MIKNSVKIASMILGSFLTIGVATALVVERNPESTSAASSITLVDSISVGDTIVIASKDYLKEFSSVNTSSGYGVSTSYTVNPNALYTFIVVEGSSSGTYSFQASNGQYLSTNFTFFSLGTDKVTLSDSISSYTSFTVSFDSSKNATISVTPLLTTKKLWYSSSNDKFNFVKSGSQGKNDKSVQLYKYEQNVDELKVDPSSLTLNSGDKVSKPTSVTANVQDQENVAYSNYSVEIGHYEDGQFVKRCDFVFNSTTVTQEDTVIRYTARDATVLGGSDYSSFDVALNIDGLAESSASEYADKFLSCMTCDGQGSVTASSTAWDEMSELFSSLSPAAQEIIRNTISSTSEDATSIQQCVARYDYIVSKYNGDNPVSKTAKTYYDFMNRFSTTQSANTIINVSTNSGAVAIIAIALVLTSGLLVFAFYKRKRTF